MPGCTSEDVLAVGKTAPDRDRWVSWCLHGLFCRGMQMDDVSSGA